MAEKLGHHIILLKAHCAVITGKTIAETFVRSVFLEENAYRQYMDSQIGTAYSLEEEEINKMAHFIGSLEISRRYGIIITVNYEKTSKTK